MNSLCTVFQRQTDIINYDGNYKNEFETIKLLHKLPIHHQAIMVSALLKILEEPQEIDKCAERSRCLREEGNRVYKTKSCKKDNELSQCLLSACHLYTQAILAAESVSEELCLGYANRGMALQEFGYFEQAYDDCVCALEYGYPEHLRHKLIMRQAHCAWKLNDANRLKQHISTLQEIPKLNSNFSTQLEQLQQELSQLQMATTEKLAQSQTGYNKTHKILTGKYKGRHMVAVKCIPENDIIFTEQAQCFVPVAQREVCHGCAATLLCAPIPCPECRQRVIYCSRRCRESHKAIHKYECDAYARNLLSLLGISHLALRMVLSYLPRWLEQLGDWRSTQNGAQLWQQLMRLADQQKNFDNPLQFMQSLCMISHLDKIDPDKVIYYALCANVLQIYLHENTSFYKDQLLGSEIPLEDWHVFLAAVIMRCAGQLLANGHVTYAMLPFTDSEYDSEPIQPEFALLLPTLWQSPYHLRLGCLHKFAATSIPIMAINLPYLSLLNHSCVPSIRTQFDGSTLRAYAAQEIAPGKEIFNCYTVDYRSANRMQRQSALRDTYKFECHCEKCSSDTPDKDYLAFRRYRCDRCAKIFQTNSHTWWLNPTPFDVLRCTICEEIQSCILWDKLLKLQLRCSEPQARGELYKAFDELSIWLLDYNNLKLYIAESLVSSIFAASGDGCALSATDYTELSNIIQFRLKGIEAQSGFKSMEYLMALTYYWDLLAMSKHKFSNKEELQRIRSSIEDCLAVETHRIFVNYYNDFIEQ